MYIFITISFFFVFFPALLRYRWHYCLSSKCTMYPFDMCCETTTTLEVANTSITSPITMSFYVVISTFETEKLNPERLSNSATKYMEEWGFQSNSLTSDPCFLTTILFCLCLWSIRQETVWNVKRVRKPV